MQSMSVRPEQVSALAGQIRSGSQGIRSELDRLESEVGKLRASWDGAAQQAYDQAQAKWNRSLSEMQQLLTQIAGKTEEISGQYVSTDRSAAGRFGA
ncbi:WXG100 family type VII secretion target [Microbacterium sp. NPDC076768]|uniref:WXG100 family type VII secretion target n=1 Tax=Microbacterium sp. NPDC076768 TaxID=3154858 RepID=UPI0034441C53